VADRAAQTIDFLSERIGPFPYSQLALTQMPGRNSQGWPGLVFLSSYAFLSPDERFQAKFDDADKIVYENLMQAHETAHQWWGDLILWHSYRDQWLVEALSNYCALLELEAKRPESFQTMMDSYRRDLERKPAGRAYHEAGPVTLGMRLSSSQFPDAYDVIAYGRGTWLIHMLRHMMREPGTGGAGRSRAAVDPDQKFFRVLRDLRNRHENKDISTRDVLTAFEEAMPPSAHFDGRKSLDWFYDEWINGTAVPRFEVSDLRLAPRGAGAVASGKIVVKDAPETMVAPLPVYAVTGRGKPVYAGRVFAEAPATEFRLNVPAGTTKLLLDPYDTVLKQ
jgi:aminopeptidase N